MVTSYSCNSEFDALCDRQTGTEVVITHKSIFAIVRQVLDAVITHKLIYIYMLLITTIL